MALDEPPRDSSDDPPANARLLDAIRSLDRADSLSAVLGTLIDCASLEATRTAVLIVRDGRLHGWQSPAFDPVTDERTEDWLPGPASALIADAMRSRREVAGGEDGSRKMFAMPLTVDGQAVAVLYADNGSANDTEPGALRPAMLEMIARHAGRCLEAVTARAIADLSMMPAGDSPRQADEQTDLLSADATEAVNESSTGRKDTLADQVAPVDVDETEDYEAARRYARLLVSEIKLYHEPTIIAGRRDGDLARRLGGEIARARVLYDQRVPDHVRSTTDYLDTQLVNMLADGDASLLQRATMDGRR